MAEANRIVKIREFTTDQVQVITGASISGASNLAWANPGSPTITRTGGSWLTDGFKAGMKITVTSSATSPANDGTFTVASVTALVLTLVPTDSVTVDATDTGAAANGKVVSGLVAGNYSGIAVIGEDIFVADKAKHIIFKGHANGLFSVFAGASGVAGSIDGALGTNRLHTPGALAVDSAKNLWVVDTGTGASISGASNLAWLAGTAPTITRTGGSWITDGFTVGTIITVVDADTVGNNGEYTVAGVSATVLTLEATTVTTDATDTGAAANGKVTGTNCKIRKIDSNGNVHTIVALPTSADGAIAVDAAGRVLMVDNTTV